MAQTFEASAASAELSGTGSITGFTSNKTSGVLLAAVYCSATETSTGAFAMSGGGLTWSLIASYLNANQSMFLFSAPFSSAVTSQTFTLTPNSPVSSRWGFIVAETAGSQNVFEPGSMTTGHGSSTALASGNFTTTNADDMLIGICLSEAGGTDTLVGASGFTAGISTTNFHANVGAAAGIVYKVVSATSSTNNAQASDTNGGGWDMGGIAIKATAGAATNTKTYTADSLLKKTFSKTVTVDAYLEKQGIAKTYSVDSYLKATGKTKTVSADALLQKLAAAKTYAVDAILFSAGTESLAYSIDALLKRLGASKTYAADAILVHRRSKTLSVDALMVKRGQVTATSDAWLFRTGISHPYTVDAILAGRFARLRETIYVTTS